MLTTILVVSCVLISASYCVKVDDLLTVNNTEKPVVWWGRGGGATKVNNLVYTKMQKHIYAIRKHETTIL